MPRDRYREIYDSFRWHVPAEFNIAEVCARRWAAETSRIALYTEDEAGRRETFTYAALMRDANRLSNALAAAGVGAVFGPGTRIPEAARRVLELLRNPQCQPGADES